MTKKERSIRARAEMAAHLIALKHHFNLESMLDIRDAIENFAHELIAETKEKCIKICEVDWPEGIVKDKKKYEAADAIAQAIRDLK